MVKDILRELKARKLQFFAILLITTLGVGFFIGIRVTGYDMRLTAEAYMESANVLDIKVMHSLGVDNEMRKEIDEIVGEKGYRLRSTDLYAVSNKFDDVIKIYEFNEATKQDLTILSGRLPVNDKEAVIDSMLQDLNDINLFDEIRLKKNDIFKEQTVIVVGVAQSSLYMDKNRGYTSLGSGEVSGFVYARGLDIKLEEVTELRYAFNDDVDIEKTIELLKAKDEDISQARFERAVAPEREKLKDAELELKQAKIDGEAKIAKEQNKLNSARIELADSKLLLEQGLDQIAFGITLNANDSLNTKLNVVNDNYNSIISASEQGIASLKTQMAALGDSPEEIATKQAMQVELEKQVSQLEYLKSQFNAGYASLKAGITDYNEGLNALNAGQIELDDAKNTLADEIKVNEKKIENAKKDIAAASEGELYVFDRKESIIGYKEFYDDSERIEAIGAVFPLIFFGVAILVTLSTVTRMIDESRMQLGVYKALGYTWFQASLKYVGFTFIAWSIGTVLGLVIGFYFLPNIIYDTYRILYETPPLESQVVFSYLIIPVVISFLSSVGVAFYKSMRVSREKAALLLRPAMPQSGQRILLERITPLWNRLGFLYKVSFRNLFRNKTRFLMTVIGIGGCAGLLITGFGLDHSVNTMIDLQFNEILKYDGFVVFDEQAQIDNSQFDEFTNVYSTNTEIGDLEANVFIVEDFAKFPQFFAFRDSKTKQDIQVSDDGVVLTAKIAEANDLIVGDTFKLKCDNKLYDAKVAAIIENYASHYLIMSEKTHNEMTGKQVTMNMRLFKKADIPDNFAETLLKDDDVLNVTLSSGVLDLFEKQMGNFNVIIYVVILAAFLLELIVLTNLITMNISERKKELATLKVLGFYPGELAKYILRENVTLTLIALVLGGVFGVYLHKFVILTAELDLVMFNRQLNLFSVVISLILTFVISVLINLVMSRKANDVDMSEALKTFDA